MKSIEKKDYTTMVWNGFCGQFSFYFINGVENLFANLASGILQVYIYYLLIASFIGDNKAKEVFPYIGIAIMTATCFQASLTDAACRIFFEKYKGQIQTFLASPTPDVVQLTAYLLSSFCRSIIGCAPVIAYIILFWENPLRSIASYIGVLVLGSLCGCLLGMPFGIIFSEVGLFVSSINIFTPILFIASGIVTQLKGTWGELFSIANPLFHLINLTKHFFVLPKTAFLRSFIVGTRICSWETSLGFLMTLTVLCSIFVPLLFSNSEKIRP